jgi:hypothetical protein
MTLADCAKARSASIHYRYRAAHGISASPACTAYRAKRSLRQLRLGNPPQ